MLDDLHNYFPDILYADNNRFRSVNDLLEYIRSQTRTQFDLFSTARRNRTRNITTQQPSIGNQIQFAFTTEDNIESPISPINQPSNDINTLLGPLTNIMNLLYPPINDTFLQPILVYPTAEQITNATSIIELSTNTEICAICQETMVDGSIRRINHCRHTFHDLCIRTHFRTNVRCPICRCDIRNL